MQRTILINNLMNICNELNSLKDDTYYIPPSEFIIYNESNNTALINRAVTIKNIITRIKAKNDKK